MNVPSGRLEIVDYNRALRYFAIACIGMVLFIPYLHAPVVVSVLISIPFLVVAFFCTCQMHTVIDFAKQTFQQEYRFLGGLSLSKRSIAFAEVDWIGARATREENAWAPSLYTVELSLKNGRTIDLKHFYVTPRHPHADREAQDLAAELSGLAGFQLRSNLAESVIPREPSD
jgi:hypothetical protein